MDFEVRYKGPPKTAAGYWGRRLSYAAQSERNADPKRELPGLEGAGEEMGDEALIARLAEAQGSRGRSGKIGSRTTG